jgi:hypothetical protein
MNFKYKGKEYLIKDIKKEKNKVIIRVGEHIFIFTDKEWIQIKGEDK